MKPAQQVSRKATEMLTANDAKESASDAQDLRVFTANALKFAVFAEDITAEVPWRRPTPLPQAPAAVLGIASIQGRMLTVLDPVVLLTNAASGSEAKRFIVALRGDEQLALAVEQQGESVAANIVNEASTKDGAAMGVIEQEGDTISVLDVKKLFALAIRGRERRQRRF